jgi:hypothetical protein
MYYKHISPELIVFKYCSDIYPMQWMRHDMLWDGSEEDGNVRSVRKMKALTVKMEAATLIGKGR